MEPGTVTLSLAEEARTYREARQAEIEKENEDRWQARKQYVVGQARHWIERIAGAEREEEIARTIVADETNPNGFRVRFRIDGLSFEFDGTNVWLRQTCERCGEPFEQAMNRGGNHAEILWRLGEALEQTSHNLRELGVDGLCPRDFDEDGNLVVLPHVDDAEMVKRKQATVRPRMEGSSAEKPPTVEENLTAALRAFIDARIPYTYDI